MWKVGSGLTAYLNLRSYPVAFLSLTAYRLGLLRAPNAGKNCHRLFAAVIARQYRSRSARSKRFLAALKGPTMKSGTDARA